MENKICQSCAMPISSVDQLGKNKDGASIKIIANIVMIMANLSTKFQWKNILKCALNLVLKLEWQMMKWKNSAQNFFQLWKGGKRINLNKKGYLLYPFYFADFLLYSFNLFSWMSGFVFCNMIFIIFSFPGQIPDFLRFDIKIFLSL